jgi:hypothetical protein
MIRLSDHSRASRSRLISASTRVDGMHCPPISQPLPSHGQVKHYQTAYILHRYHLLATVITCILHPIKPSSSSGISTYHSISYTVTSPSPPSIPHRAYTGPITPASYIPSANSHPLIPELPQVTSKLKIQSITAILPRRSRSSHSIIPFSPSTTIYSINISSSPTYEGLLTRPVTNSPHTPHQSV